MRISCGIDTIRISRIRDVVDRKGSRFLERVYTAGERWACEAKGVGCVPSLAARFAAKEAVSKALGTGIGHEGISFCDIEVIINKGGKPELRLHGRAEEFFLHNGGFQAEISMSHDGDQAVAVCVMQFENNMDKGSSDEISMG
ncbi:MAG: holo-ACP synthase [Eubacteriales bacterium]